MIKEIERKYSYTPKSVNNGIYTPSSEQKRHHNKVLAACVISCMLFTSPAFAAGADSDVSKLGTPTLDTLAGQEIPDGDGAVYPNSGYTLKEVFPADVENLPQNVITKYEIKEITKYYDPTTGAEVAEGDRLPDVEYKEVVTKEAIPHYFEVNLANTNYGTGAQSIIFNWELNDEGQYTLKESTDVSGNSSIIYHYDGTSLQTVNNSYGDYGDITGNFVKLSGSSDGGAIYNSAQGSDTIRNTTSIGDITGDFIGNSAGGAGGAIYNRAGYNPYINRCTATIKNITGDFIGNSAGGSGGAIYNYSSYSYSSTSIGDITGDFIGNSAGGAGGAIYNRAGGSIGDITGDFIGNSAGSSGGAIYNYACNFYNSSGTTVTLGNITGDFIGNSAPDGSGGAIYNYSDGGSTTIGNITGDFIGNSAGGSGGAIYNSAEYNYWGTGISSTTTIENITGDFIGNSAGGSGGAIYNYANNYDDTTRGTTSIGNINGDFIGNSAGGSGGAIYNYAYDTTATIGNITGDFIGNSASDNEGGAIYNTEDIGNITGDFIGNSAGSSGGAIYHAGTIEDITGDFIGNSASDDKGGAIYNNEGDIVNITGDFIGNSAGSSGGAIYNYAEYKYWATISSTTTIENITGDFIGNSADGSGGAIYNYANDINNSSGTTATIGNITGNFIGNSAGGYGGAIYNNEGDIGNITGDFIRNSAGGYGGAIYNNEGDIGNITGDFIGNSADGDGGGAIYNDEGDIGNITGDFIGNSAGGSGGAIYNDEGDIGNITGDFIGNSAIGMNSEGGAIYNNGTITLTPGSKDMIFKGNFTADSQNPDGSYVNQVFNAIYNNSNGIINLDAGNHSIIFYDGIDSSTRGTWNALSGDIKLLGDTNNFGNLNIGTADSGDISVDLINGKTQIVNINKLTLNSNMNLGIDIDLAHQSSDNLFIADSAATNGNNLNISNINLLTELEDYDYVAIKVINTDTGLSISSTVDSYLTTNYKYDISAFDLGNNSYLLVKKEGVNIGLPEAVLEKGTVVYSQTEDENISRWLVSSNIHADDFTLNGNGYNITAIDQLNGMTLDNNKRMSITNANFSGFSSKTGGVIDANGNLELTSTSFTNNTAAADGGAINAAGNTTITDASFTNNSAATNGGAINAAGNTTITNATFSNNSAATNGGAINAASNTTITDASFSNNTAAADGGAINSASNTTITNATFSNNSAAANGGAINAAGNTTITDASFSNNSAVSGGAINHAQLIDISSGLGMSNSFDITYGDKSITYHAGELYNGMNFVLLIKEEAPDEETFNESETEINEMIQSGEVAGSISDLPVYDTPSVSAEDLLDIVPGVTFSYNGEILGTYFISDVLKEFSAYYQFGVYNPNTPSGDIEIVIKDTVFSNNTANNPSGDAFGGAVTILGLEGFTGQDLFESIAGEVVSDISGDFASKEEALAAIESAGYVSSLDGFESLFSDEYTIEGRDPKVTFINSKFTGNKAVSESGSAKGGAIYSKTDLTIKADAGESSFSGNTANGVSNAIYMDNKDKTLSLIAQNEGRITFDDKIDGQAGYKISISGDNDKSTVILNNNVDNAIVSSENVALRLGINNVFQNSDFTINSGSLSFINNIAEPQIMQSAHIAGNINLGLDVDLANEIMDTLPSNATIAPNTSINVNNLNIISSTNKENLGIFFAPADYADSVSYTGDSSLSYQETNTVYSPIYKYDVEYSVNEDDGLGYFWFNRTGGGSGNPSDSFNPTVLAQPAAAQSGGQAVISETMHFAFQHADTFSILPSSVRLSIINNSDNRYAINDTIPFYSRVNNKGFWVRPFTTFESMDLKNGPDVDAVTYGTLIGFDTDFQEFGHGWYGVTSGYVGYNGASLSYSDVDTIMNGGLLGATQTFYKGNFFSAITLTAGASAGSSSSNWGSEDFAMLLAGIGSKTGYNFEFNDGKFIVQPLLALNYSFVNTFDYTNAQGVSIESDPVHNLQINPAIRLIGNLKNGWQPYASVGMVWNVLNSSHVTANDIILPKMSVKPYVEYGLGIQRNWAEKYSAFLQAMVRNGGRTGVALTAGFRWAIGEEPSEEN